MWCCTLCDDLDKETDDDSQPFMRARYNASHLGLNPNLPQPVQTNCCPNVNSRTPDAPRKQEKHFTSAKCPTQPPGTHRPRRKVSPKCPDRRPPNPMLTTIDHAHPPHGIAERPERFRPAPVCKTQANSQTTVSPERPICAAAPN